MNSLYKEEKIIMGKSTANLLLFIVTLFGLIFQGSDGVKDVQLEGPRYARRGEDLMLRCNYDLETDSLYAVKWYRGSEEFYRFLPKEAPPKQAFPINGVVVDVNKSDEHSVFLRNLSFETNGRFKCVISAEGTFQTLENAKDIEVIVIDYNSPKLYLDKMSYQPGEQGLANCSVERTYPAPNITWFINGQRVNLSVMTKVVPATDEQPYKEQQRPRQKGGRSRVGSSGGSGGGGYYTTPLYTITTTTSTTTTTSSSSSSNGGGLQSGLNKNGDKKNGSGSGGSGDKDKKLTSSVSALTFIIHQSYSPMTIKCTGTLYDVYNETSSIQIQPKAPMYNPYSTASTPPRSQTKYGLPNQLQTFNQSSSSSSSSIANNDGTTYLIHATPVALFLPFFTFLIQIMVTTATNTITSAQFPEVVPHCPLLQRLG